MLIILGKEMNFVLGASADLMLLASETHGHEQWKESKVKEAGVELLLDILALVG